MPDRALALAEHAGPDRLLEIKRDRLMPCVYHFYKRPPQIVGARGATLIDSEGREYLDCFAGVTVMNAGHCNPEIIEPAIEQIRTLQHTTTIYLTEPQLALAEELTTIAPRGLTRSFFTASGSEATEGALLLACLHTNRPGVLSFDNSLHGRTRWAMNATGSPMWRTDPFPLDQMHKAPFGDADAVEAILRDHPGEIAAIIGEPVQGNGGVNVPPPGFWPRVRELCDRHGVLLVFDEVQTGFNRTGRWFASEHWGVEPDVMAISKALGNGFPIAAFMAREGIARSYTRPGASTHGGNPVAAVAALATIRFHKANDLGALARDRGAELRAGLDAVRRARPGVAEPPRGLGCMLGLPLITEDGAPDAAGCDRVLEDLKDRGVLAGKTGPGRNVLTFMPPLTITAQEIAHVVDVLESVL